MTDKTPEDIESEAVSSALQKMAGTYDSRILLCAFLAFAGVIGEKLIAAKLFTKEEVEIFFANAAVDATTPTGKAVAVHYKDGNQALGRKH